MRITESQLRTIIRRSLLTEAAKRPQDVPPDVMIVCRQSAGIGGSVTFRPIVKRARMSVIGMVTWDEGKPGKPNAVTTASADPGWGPLLYDMAMEMSGDRGLMPDRVSVSEEARAVWDYYMWKRPDVEHVQYDNRWNELTPTPNDNVEQLSAEEDPTAKPWYRSSLSKAYRRKDGRTPTLDALEAMGKIVWETYEDEEED